MRKEIISAIGLVFLLVFGFGAANASCNIDNGKKVYEKSCSMCHGKVGKPNMPKMPDFSKGERMEKPDDKLLVSIGNGVPGTVMPAWGGKLAEAEMEDALCYIKSLKPQESKPAEKALKAEDGNKKAPTEDDNKSPCAESSKKKDTKAKPKKAPTKK